MPGMMDTVLNLGLNDETVQGLAATSGDERFAWDSYRRFIQMYSDVVLGLDHGAVRGSARNRQGRQRLLHRHRDDRRRLARRWSAQYKQIVARRAGPATSRRTSTSSSGARSRAVFDSWDSDRAKVYRRLNDIPGDWGTAVNVQAMVFGNMGETSATGVAFTRDPGDRREGLLRRMAGQRPGRGRRRRHPHAAIPDQGARAKRAGANAPSMEEAMPEAYAELAACLRPARKALQGHAGHRVHRRARQAVDAADPHRQAHRQGGAQDGGRHGRAKG